jgi:hypothetical protein
MNFIESNPFQSNIAQSKLESYSSVFDNINDGAFITNFANPKKEEGSAEEIKAAKKLNQESKDSMKEAKYAYTSAFSQLKADLGGFNAVSSVILRNEQLRDGLLVSGWATTDAHGVFHTSLFAQGANYKAELQAKLEEHDTIKAAETQISGKFITRAFAMLKLCQFIQEKCELHASAKGDEFILEKLAGLEIFSKEGDCNLVEMLKSDSDSSLLKLFDSNNSSFCASAQTATNALSGLGGFFASGSAEVKSDAGVASTDAADAAGEQLPTSGNLPN